MTGDIPFRPATKADAPDLAYLHATASGGMIEIMYRDVVPGLSAVDLFAEIMARDIEPYSWLNCVVAEDGGEVVGKLHSFAADDESKFVDDPRVPRERYEILAPLERLVAPGTWHISAVAVRPSHQGRGLGKRFLQLAQSQARERDFAEISLHVFEDNRDAVAFYEIMGFRIAGRCALDHPGFAEHNGDFLLMRCAV